MIGEHSQKKMSSQSALPQPNSPQKLSSLRNAGVVGIAGGSAAIAVTVTTTADGGDAVGMEGKRRDTLGSGSAGITPCSGTPERMREMYDTDVGRGLVAPATVASPASTSASAAVARQTTSPSHTHTIATSLASNVAPGSAPAAVPEPTPAQTAPAPASFGSTRIRVEADPERACAPVAAMAFGRENLSAHIDAQHTISKQMLLVADDPAEGLRTLAFPSLSTGAVYAFDLTAAASVAVAEVGRFLSEHRSMRLTLLLVEPTREVLAAFDSVRKTIPDLEADPRFCTVQARLPATLLRSIARTFLLPR